MKNNKKIIIISFIVLIVIGLGFFIYNISKNGVKFSRIGNNSTSQEIVDYILDISSYELQADIEVNSNKSTNKYQVKQQYINPNISVQEIIKPENIQGMKITRKDNNLKIENTQLQTSKIFEEYKGMTDSIIDLSSFIQNYRNNHGDFKEENDFVVMTAKNSSDNKYTQIQILYINKSNGEPVKMEIKDINQKTTFFIVYKEVKINETKEKNITAFERINLVSQI